jgi:hypothetical protein
LLCSSQRPIVRRGANSSTARDARMPLHLASNKLYLKKRLLLI